MVPSNWFLEGGGDMGGRMRAFDWATSPLGDPATWPETLRSNVSLMLSSGFPTLILWGPDLALLYNDAYSVILDGKHPSSLGQPFETVWPEVWPALAPLIARSIAGEAIFIEDMQLRLERKGYPEESYFTFFYSPLRMENGTVGGISCGCIETTEKVSKGKQAHDLLVDPNAYWDFAPEMIVVMDYQGVFIDVSAAGEKILGWSRSDMVNQSYAGFLHPEDLAGTDERATALFADGMTIDHFENRYRHKDGGFRWLSWTGASARGRFYAAAHDVTAEKEQTETLRQSQVRASTYFDFSEDYLFMIRVDANGIACFEDMNLATERIMGLSRVHVKGMPVAQAVPADSAADITKHALACLKAGEPQRYLASRRYQDGQATTLIEGRVAFIERFEAGGGLVLFSGSDVTEQRGIEEALRQSQKMEAVGQLTGGLAHDFNNLLAVVTGNLELMALRLGKGRYNDLDRFMAAAQAASKRATSLTHRLLAFSRRQTLAPKATGINDLVEDIRWSAPIG